jgi:hypothetical protein
MLRAVYHRGMIGLRRLSVVPFAAALGLVGINSAVSLLLYPERSPIHELAAPFDYAWAVIYSLGGLMMLAGIATARIDVETAGCVAFGGGAIINAVAWAAVMGWSAWNTVLILTIFAIASLIRGWHVSKGRVLILVETDGDDQLRVVTTGNGAEQ